MRLINYIYCESPCEGGGGVEPVCGRREQPGEVIGRGVAPAGLINERALCHSEFQKA